MNYFKNLDDLLLAKNKKAFNLAKKTGQFEAWENVKEKNLKKHTPRGKAFRLFTQKRWLKHFTDIEKNTVGVKKLLNELKACG